MQVFKRVAPLLANEVLVSKSQDARNHYEMLEAEFYAASPSCLASTGVADSSELIARVSLLVLMNGLSTTCSRDG
jgi:hypothetical protein